MHWFAWWKMCIPTNKGGMGFRDIQCFNLALLAKQAWRPIENPDSLCAKILKAKYYPNDDLLNVNLKKKCSYTWQSITAGVETPKSVDIYGGWVTDRKLRYGRTVGYLNHQTGRLFP